MTIAPWYRYRYRLPMAMNLRMDDELASALRHLSQETGRSQQDLAREAVAEYVRDYPLRAFPKEIRHLVSPPRQRSRDLPPMEPLPVPEGWDSVAVIRELRGDR